MMAIVCHGAGVPTPTSCDIAAASLSPSVGLRAAEPFFLVVAKVAPGPVTAALLHDRTGVVRFSLPPEPLLWQWVRSFRQLLQERYQI